MDKTTHFAPVDAVRDYAGTLNAQQLRCRDFGHNWKSDNAERRTDGGFDRTLICPCRTQRKQRLDARGVVVASSYDYGHGYQMPRGIGRISSDDRGVLRLASIEKILADQESRAGRRPARRGPAKRAVAAAPAEKTAAKKAPAKKAAAKKSRRSA